MEIHVVGENRQDIIGQVKSIVASYLEIGDPDEAITKCDMELSVLYTGESNHCSAVAYIKFK